MNTIGIILLVLAVLAGLVYVGSQWARRRTTVRPDLFELDRQEDLYRYGVLDRMGRSMKSIRAKWLNRGKSQQNTSGNQ